MEISMSGAVSVSQPFALLHLLAQETISPGKDSGLALLRGMIVEILDDGEISVQISPDADESSRIRCDYLETGQGPPPLLVPGDLVLVLRPAALGQNGCVLGRIGRYRPPAVEPDAVPDHVVIEAGESLTIKCGEGSVDLRKDGKVMIRGSDVLSRAKRTNRIKGGSVAIN